MVNIDFLQKTEQDEDLSAVYVVDSQLVLNWIINCVYVPKFLWVKICPWKEYDVVRMLMSKVIIYCACFSDTAGELCCEMVQGSSFPRFAIEHCLNCYGSKLDSSDSDTGGKFCVEYDMDHDPLVRIYRLHWQSLYIMSNFLFFLQRFAMSFQKRKCVSFMLNFC